MAREQRVRFVLLQFTDILGVLKSVAIPVEQLPAALAGEIMFDGSSVMGFARIEESDMMLMPDPSTYALLRWPNPQGGDATARLICDILTVAGDPFAGCPRQALKRVVARAESMGYVMNAGPEAEFFLFHCDEEGQPSLITHDQGGYFDLAPLDQGKSARRDMVIALQDMGFAVEAAHHEVAPAQHEIDFRYADALSTADRIVTFKTVVRSVAQSHRLHATFMPKPVRGVNGSGMHLHQSLYRGGENAFYSPGERWQLSDTCLHYLAGLMKHAMGFTAITNPLVNSYKRLVPGYEAPVYVAWSERNRSPLIRIPARRGEGTRVELRSPDPSSNPYLALAATLAAGLDGIERCLEAPRPVDGNIYRMTDRERRRLGIVALPSSLEEALYHLEQDPLMRQALGDHIFESFIHAKRLELEDYSLEVHPWELDHYLAVY